MREIKFRCFDKKKKKWIWDKKPFWIIGETTMFDCLNQYSIEALNDLEVVQYTGLKDKNGVEIYEGDILYMDFGKAEVYFENGCFKIRFNIDSDLLWLYCCKNDKTKVIGNIYDNPELMENKK